MFGRGLWFTGWTALNGKGKKDDDKNDEIEGFRA